jgi:hypothetical protein
MIFCSLVAGGAGGAAGAAMLSIWPALLKMSSGGMPPSNDLLALPAAIAAGLFLALFGGVAVGAIIGFVPSFLVGLAMTALSRWRPFQSLALWALAGGAAGFVVANLIDWKLPTDSRPVWVIGGAAAMMTYWGLGLRTFKLKLVPASSTQA